MIYSKCIGRISQHSSQTAEQRKHGCSVVTKAYGSDQEESMSELRHSDRPNEFPRSTGRVFVLFSETGLEFQSKSLQRWWVWKWSARFEMKGNGGYCVRTSPLDKLMQTICCHTDSAIQHLAEKEPVSRAAVCSSRRPGWQTSFSLLCRPHDPILSLTLAKSATAFH